MTEQITNDADVIDSRDVIARIEELRDELADLESEANDDTNAAIDEAREALNDWREEYGDELAALEALQEEAAGYAADWQYGEALIRDSYFTEYAMELLADIGDLPREIPHYIVIDEDATAANIQQDYTRVDFAGVDYWIR